MRRESNRPGGDCALPQRGLADPSSAHDAKGGRIFPGLSGKAATSPLTGRLSYTGWSTNADNVGKHPMRTRSRALTMVAAKG
jgi:hypothetical protein